jgi:hypothetical protein
MILISREIFCSVTHTLNIASDIWLVMCYQNSEALFTTRFLWKFNSICRIDIDFVSIEWLAKMRNIKPFVSRRIIKGPAKATCSIATAQ